MACWTQLRLLLWKNLTFRRRQTVSLVFFWGLLSGFSPWCWVEVGEGREEESAVGFHTVSESGSVDPELCGPSVACCVAWKGDSQPGRNTGFGLCQGPGMSSDVWFLGVGLSWSLHYFFIL